ncbi:hypothetical protein O181_078922 [Austropuccinia psidii MF-1]|uniref:Uncharacterized protein n=1 Tax=Austropuccinia psidii MF-1 TaxID=1389203 RepID=A0A9Q3FL49_9BASI|nr:hypothetical protein [Austropuccinia psidii MF-1]
MVPVNEGANTRSKKNKPQWEWKISTKAPKDINSNISQENIIDRQSRTNQALAVDLGEEAAKQKDEALYKNNKIISTEMNTQTELNEGNPEEGMTGLNGKKPIFLN